MGTARPATWIAASPARTASQTTSASRAGDAVIAVCSGLRPPPVAGKARSSDVHANVKVHVNEALRGRSRSGSRSRGSGVLTGYGQPPRGPGVESTREARRVVTLLPQPLRDVPRALAALADGDYFPVARQLPDPRRQLVHGN